MSSQPQDENNYRVEVSGWDVTESFFVEKTALKWGGQSGKEICVHSPLRQGSVIFVRLLQPLAPQYNFPIAYRAVSVGTRDARGLIRVGLEQLRPRYRPHQNASLPVLQTEPLPS